MKVGGSWSQQHRCASQSYACGVESDYALLYRVKSAFLSHPTVGWREVTPPSLAAAIHYHSSYILMRMCLEAHS
jgi:hypothetical protein